MLVAAMVACDERDDRAPDDPGAPIDDLAFVGAPDDTGGTTDAGDTAGDEDTEIVEREATDDDALEPAPLVEDEVVWALDHDADAKTSAPRMR
jgi:hypothetical protein